VARLLVVLALLLCVCVATAMASTSVGGAKQRAIVQAVAKRDHLVLSSQHVAACLRTRTYDGWAMNMVAPFTRSLYGPHGLCNIKADVKGKLYDWQPAIAIPHQAGGQWRFVWEFDETTAKIAKQHRIPPWIYKALV